MSVGQAPSPASPRPESGRGGLTADRIFAGGLASFRAGEHGQAVLEFMDLIARFPRHPLAAKAQWWVGEAYSEQGDVRQALSEFQKVPELYPRSSVVPDALLRIGLCYRTLGDTPRARAAWRQLVQQHGTSEPATQARVLLARARDVTPRATR